MKKSSSQRRTERKEAVCPIEKLVSKRVYQRLYDMDVMKRY